MVDLRWYLIISVGNRFCAVVFGCTFVESFGVEVFLCGAGVVSVGFIVVPLLIKLLSG